jgi:hypothetical protein
MPNATASLRIRYRRRYRHFTIFPQLASAFVFANIFDDKVAPSRVVARTTYCAATSRTDSFSAALKAGRPPRQFPSYTFSFQ